MAFIVVYDACVLYPAPLRDLLMHLARTKLFQAKWTETIHDEWIRNLIQRGYDAAKLRRTRELMDAAVRDCLVSGYETLIDSLELPDPNDRHVLAAAIRAKADTIVTTNTKHFPTSTLSEYKIEAQHPDDFVMCQIDLSEGAVYAAIRKHRASLRNPPKSVEEYLDTLIKQRLPQTAERLRKVATLL